MESAEKLKIIVIGAGSTGLLLAQGLKQNGIECEVYEKEESSSYHTRPREWGMTLHWGASFIEKCIPPEMRPKLNEGICCDPFYGEKDLTLPHYNALTGEKLFDMPGEEPRRISRKKLRNFLSQGVHVEYGRALTGVDVRDDLVVATFSDGTTASGSLIVGCDSANSAVREELVGEEAAKVEDLDIQMFNVSCSFPKDIALLQRMGHPVFKNSYHPDGFMWWQSIQDVQDPDKPETWLFQNVLSWIGKPRAEELPDRESRLKFWREKSQRFAEPWRSVGENLPDDIPLSIDHTTVWRPTMDWSSSKFGRRVTLAGDAAHPMPPHRGQGLNNALQDASALVDELAAVKNGEKTLEDAVTAYEKDMRDRTLVEIPISIAQAQMVHNFDTLMEAPFFKHGMNKYREMKEQSGEAVEVATMPKAE